MRRGTSRAPEISVHDQYGHVIVHRLILVNLVAGTSKDDPGLLLIIPVTLGTMNSSAVRHLTAHGEQGFKIYCDSKDLLVVCDDWSSHS